MVDLQTGFLVIHFLEKTLTTPRRIALFLLAVYGGSIALTLLVCELVFS